MKLKIIDNATNAVVYERDTISGVSWTIDGGDFVARTTESKPSEGRAPAGTIPFGFDKGKPITGASRKTLEFLRKVSEESLANPEKEKYRESNEALLSNVMTEMKRQGIEVDGVPF